MGANLNKLDDDRLADAVGRVIIRRRKARGITRDGLAYSAGLHINTLYGVEVGIKRKSGHRSHTRLTMASFIRVAYVLGCTPGTLLQDAISEASGEYILLHSAPNTFRF